MSDIVIPQSQRTRTEDSTDAAGGAPRRGVASRIAARLGGGILQVVLVLVALFWLLPTVGLFISSLRPEAANNSTGWWTVFTKPAELTFSNYQQLLDNPAILNSLLNTVIITVASTVIIVAVAAMAAYAFAWIDFPGRDWIFILVVALLVVPIQIGLIPIADLYGKMGIYGTIAGVVLFHVAYGLPFAIFLLRNFFAGIPRDLLEAARMDGGTELTIFRKVILPLGLPAIASLAIFQFLWVWNDLLVALVFADPDNAPLTVYLRGQTRQLGANIDILAPGAFLSLLIPLIVFFSFQRYFVQGVMAGSVK
ncbi:MAG: carbohydrate ABC transporter permease [Longispora sp.]|nr:carbohydrate ABC transporter permease [Longispora sp. (in: high G+C Gram-positive bacteria)]